MTLIRGSPEYVMFPTVNNDTLSTVRLTHMTYRERKKNMLKINHPEL